MFLFIIVCPFPIEGRPQWAYDTFIIHLVQPSICVTPAPDSGKGRTHDP